MDTNGKSQQAASLPKGGGAIRDIGEKFGANPVTGTGFMTVPIVISPGRAGFQPQLSLSYDSGTGNGPFGLGWRLSLPSISRKTDKGLPQYCNTDVFIFTGYEDFVPIKGDVTQRCIDGISYIIQRYRPRVDDLFMRIEQWTRIDTQETHWKTVTKDNISTLYGSTNKSRIYKDQHIFSWLICESYDDRGNIIVYEYVGESDDNVDKTRVNERNRMRTANRYLKRIKYGNLTDRSEYMFEVVFDYGEHDHENPKPHDKGAMAVRKDPFSSYKSGFEVRTYRLCQRVLMFNHFLEENIGKDCLVKSTDFTYHYELHPKDVQNPVYSVLSSVTQTGYKRNYDGSYIRKLMPSLDFHYSKAVINEEVKYMEIDNLPYQWIDLDGEGMSGIVTEHEDQMFYKRNLSPISKNLEAEFAPAELMTSKPAGNLQFADLAGDGRISLVDFRGSTPGFYKRTPHRGWDNFTPFNSLPVINWDDPNMQFIDLDGDGHNDILITEGKYFTWYRSLAEGGFTISQKVYQSWDEETGPCVIFSDGTQSIHLADMSGDGLTDIVRVCNRETCYWPNLGYGRFGAKVTMDNSPNFDDPLDYDPKRVKLIDIDGSGTTDILYFGSSGVHIYFNQSGNGWSANYLLQIFIASDSVASVTAMDLLGNGTACLVWSSVSPSNPRRTINYVSLMGADKPHLLTKYTNNMGAKTTIKYEPSTKHYLQDKTSGKRWITKVPFPVHVVKQVDTHDMVSKNKFTTSYSYHHGYFDGKEREFIGFGRVDQLDTDEIDGKFLVPPVLTKTWFHTGAYLDQGAISRQYAHEYYKEPNEYFLPDTVLPNRLTIEEEYEAARALKGRVLRQEIYAVDQSNKQFHPYSVSEKSYIVRLEQHQLNNPYSVFSVQDDQTIDYHYERNHEDPRITHGITLKVDEFNNVLELAAIAYPRRQPAYPEQSKTLITYTKNRVTNINNDPVWYRVGIPIESCTYEISALCHDLPFTVNSFLQQLSTAEEIFYEQEVLSDRPQKRLIERTRTLYRKNKDANTTDPSALPLGEVESLALPCESFKLAFTEGLLSSVYGNKISPDDLNKEKYLKFDGWWVPSGRQAFDPDQFYLPVQAKDPFDNTHNTIYDNYHMLATQFIDPLDNTTLIKNNYCNMLPKQITDPNGNRSEVAFDALGMVVGQTVMGKQEDAEGDSFSDFKVDMSSDEVVTFFETENPVSLAKKYLGTATTRFIYNLDHVPVCAAAIVRETHASDKDVSKVQLSFVYSDGLGREMQNKAQSEPDSLTADPRWVGTGTKIYNNKGKVVRQYEPFFSSSHKFNIEQWGVSSTLFYDPLDRVIATLHPNHTYEKVVFDTWQHIIYDTNDTATLDPTSDADVAHLFTRLPREDYLPTWYQRRIDGELGTEEKRAAEKTAKHACTPTIYNSDTLGRIFLTTNDSKKQTRIKLDIEGNSREIKDVLNRTVMKLNYNMLSHCIHQISMDAGNRWIFYNSVNEPVRMWNDRDSILRTTYDALYRPTTLFVKTGSNPEILAEKTVYGEQQGSRKNHRGKVYQHFDGSGVTTNIAYDFKGNIIHSKFQLAKNYKTSADWLNPDLETEVFSSSTVYDALNRPTEMTAPHSGTKLNVTHLSYNEANLLEKINVELDNTTTFQAVTNINRNAKGQRTSIEYGNGTKTIYTYEKDTFRLTKLETISNSTTLQCYSYTYDPVGNIVHIRDDAQQTIFFNNQVVRPHCDYTYDSVYRLIEACGREHISKYPLPGTYWNDKYNTNLYHPNNGQAMQKYTEQYVYDKAGNFERISHHAAKGSWTRAYSYDEPSIVEQSVKSNRLSSTKIGSHTEQYSYNVHGSMTDMPHLTLIEWNYNDHLSATSKQRASKCETTYYVYNSKGQRVRKITEDPNGTRKKERIYLGTSEVYRKFNDDIELERETLHIMDDQQKIALIEKTDHENTSPTHTFSFQHSNHAGSVALETNEKSEIISYEEYYPYGSTSYHATNKNIKAAAKRYRYTGKERDEENGLYYHGARYYAPWLGLWTAFDPATWKGNDETPYAYVQNRPIIAYDPDGRLATLPAAAVGALIGGLLGGGIEAGRQFVTEGSITSWTKVGASAAGGAVSGALTGLTAGANLVAGGAIAAGASGANLVAGGAIAAGASVAGGATTRAIAGEKQTIGTVATDAIVGLATFGVVRGGSAIVQSIRGTAAKQVEQQVAKQTIQQVEQQAVQQVEKHAVQQVEKQAVKATILETGGRRRVPPDLTYMDWDLAETAYDIIRNTKDDIASIAKNINIRPSAVARVKNHLFFLTHQLDEKVARFDADPLIANAWYRLQSGTHTTSDLALFQHELFESKFEGIFKTIYRIAHNAAEQSGRKWNP